MDEFSGDAQQFSGYVRAVSEPLGAGIALEDLAQDGEQLLSDVTDGQRRYRADARLDLQGGLAYLCRARTCTWALRCCFSRS